VSWVDVCSGLWLVVDVLCLIWRRPETSSETVKSLVGRRARAPAVCVNVAQRPWGRDESIRIGGQQPLHARRMRRRGLAVSVPVALGSISSDSPGPDSFVSSPDNWDYLHPPPRSPNILHIRDFGGIYGCVFTFYF